MNSLFVDTGAFVARILVRDQHHHASAQGWKSLEDIQVKLFSSEHILDEAVSLLIRQAGAGYAVRWAREHISSREIEWINTNKEDWNEAVHWIEKFSDQKVCC